MALAIATITFLLATIVYEVYIGFYIHTMITAPSLLVWHNALEKVTHRMSYIGLVFHILLQIFFVYFFVCMRNTLQKYTSKKLSETTGVLNTLFFLEILSLTFSLFLSICIVFDVLKHVLCQISVRYILFQGLNYLVDIFTIIPILTLHSKTFSVK